MSKVLSSKPDKNNKSEKVDDNSSPKVLNKKYGQKKATGNIVHMNYTYKFMLIAFTFVFLLCSLKIGYYFYHSYKSKKAYAELKKIYDMEGTISGAASADSSGENPDSLESSALAEHSKENLKNSIIARQEAENAAKLQLLRQEKFNALQKVNKDIAGWIYIPNTRIDYPVVKGKDNEFYLTHDVTKNTSQVGTIFLECENILKSDMNNSDRNLVMYGHNMKDGSMFKDLTRFRETAFFDANRYIYFDTKYGRYKWEIFSVFITSPDYNYRQIKFETTEEYYTYLDNLQKKSMHYAPIRLSSKDHIITLSTCSYEFQDARLVVIGRLVK